MRSLPLAASLCLTLSLPLTAQTTSTASPTHHRTIHKSLHHMAPKLVKHVVHHTATRPATVHIAARPTVHATPHPATVKTIASIKPLPAKPVTPTPFDQTPIVHLRGNARALVIFAPDTTNPALRRQLSLLERDEMALAQHNTILVPVIIRHHATDLPLPGENIKPGTPADQLSARLEFAVKRNDFTVILLDKDGSIKLRSSTPVTVNSIGAHLDGFTDPGE